MDLSIIIPIYNVEKYVRECIESVFHQDLDEGQFEVIIVNDGTKDKSMEVIADIIDAYRNIVIINQENQGLSMARNNGIAIAKGEYILMVDSDDLLIENSVRPLLEKALETKADMIVADFAEMNDKIIEQGIFMSLQSTTIDFTEIRDEDIYLNSFNPIQCYVWHTLYRTAFLRKNNIAFLRGMRYEDIAFTHECYLKATMCLLTPKPIYIYRVNRADAITASFDIDKAKELAIVIGKTWELNHLQGISQNVVKKIQENLYHSFSLLIYKTMHSIKSTSGQYQILKTIRQTAPDIFFSGSIKQRVESLLFRNTPSIYLLIRRCHLMWIHQHQKNKNSNINVSNKKYNE
jgi:glycosyltransferase involved in cell wall biosynthesis